MLLVRISKGDIEAILGKYPKEWVWHSDSEMERFLLCKRDNLNGFPWIVATIQDTNQLDLPGIDGGLVRRFRIYGGPVISAGVAALLAGIRSLALTAWLCRSGGGDKPFVHYLFLQE